MTGKHSINVRFWAITLMILLAASSRILPHPPNFAPIGAMALFGARYFKPKYISFIIPLTSIWISDIVLNNVIYGQYFNYFVWFYQGCYWTYGSFILIVIVGIVSVKKVMVQYLIPACIISSTIFFLISNFGVWFSSGMYPKNLTGLWTCYIAGLPFFKNTILGDTFYTAVLFGVFEFVQKRVPAIQSRTTQPL